MKKFSRTFWISNTMELFERWAWYGLFMVLALYLTKSTDEGALGFSQEQKGSMMGIVTAILYFLPLITGTLADRFGYKKTLILAYFILATGYYMMGTYTDYTSVFLAFLYVAVGAALFKPVISATISKTTTKENSSIGFGIFYMMINIGGLLGPLFASKLRDAYGWKLVFIMASSVILINMFLVLFFYKEPEREKSNDPVLPEIGKALKNIFTTLKDIKLAVLLIIMIGFWTVFLQLYFTLPNFIDQWVDTVSLRNSLHSVSPFIADSFGNNTGGINPEMLLNLDAGFIIIFQLLISTIAMRFRPVNAILVGAFVNSVGIAITFATGNPIYTILGIFIFSLGEMSASPKYTEYIGLIAPLEKKGLYMGTSFLPVAVGNYLAGYFSGTVYQETSDKVSLLRLEVEKRGFDIPEISGSFTQNDFFTLAGDKMQMTSTELTQYLWETYNPSKIWYIFAVITLVTVISLFAYDKFLLKASENKSIQ